MPVAKVTTDWTFVSVDITDGADAAGTINQDEEGKNKD
jgi:hypothetical protein